ncbi:MAG: hypothetical protein IT380_10855 [Myxococcales bacterium]|nr:hypothetical protein [Myxococcales bacterium]
MSSGRAWTTWVGIGLALVLGGSACQCGPGEGDPDGGVEDPDGGRRRPDSGTIIVRYPDASIEYPEVYAGEDCPAESYGLTTDEDGGVVSGGVDGGVRYGLCVALRELTGEALLNGAPVSSFNLLFLGGGFRSEVDRSPDSLGRYDVKVMRSRYDMLKYWPKGVFPTHEGHQNLGFLDMTKDQARGLVANSHQLRGSALFGGLPFISSVFPQDIFFRAYGIPEGQTVATPSHAGAYELSLLEGTFTLFLDTPPSALYGTQLSNYQVVNRNLSFLTDQELDIDIPTSLLEGELTLDGLPMPDRRVGADYQLAFVRPGDAEAQAITHHEGGLPGYSALVPKGRYGVQLRFEGAPDRHLPSEIWNKPLTPFLDLTQDGQLSANLTTHWIEGGLLIDGKPPPANPNYNWRLFMFGASNAAETSSFLLYEVPLESGAFQLRTFPGDYFTILWVDEGLGADLAEGFYVVDRFLQVHQDRSLPILIETAMFSGRLTIDGTVPAPGRRAGWLSFRNRAMSGQYSWYRRAVTLGEDGFFRVRLPKGEYEVFFTIDNETFPEYATGRELLVPRLLVDEPVVQDLKYETVVVSGPLRVAGKVVEDTLGGFDVGLKMTRQSDLRDWEWGFLGGKSDYVMRVPEGDYALDFVIYENAIDGVAFGNAPMGRRINVLKQPGQLDPR